MDKNEFQKIIDEISFPIDGYVLYTIKDKNLAVIQMLYYGTL